jgi:hypothetical protein
LKIKESIDEREEKFVKRNLDECDEQLQLQQLDKQSIVDRPNRINYHDNQMLDNHKYDSIVNPLIIEEDEEEEI